MKSLRIMRDEEYEWLLLFSFLNNRIILYREHFLVYYCVTHPSTIICLSLFSFSYLCYFIRYLIFRLFLWNFLGPYGVNGVPLRRVNQRYVIATSTKVNLAGVDVASIDDAFFARGKADSEKLSPARKAAQEKVDAALNSNIAKVAQLGDYLKNKFRLSKSDKPHLLKF